MVPEPEFRYKQCLIIRNDVKMSCGKRCAQAGHAAIGAYNGADKTLQKAWLSEGQKKVVLKVPGVPDLFRLRQEAEQAGIASAIVIDAGLTEIPAGTVTALGLGPAHGKLMDKVTGKLKLV